MNVYLFIDDKIPSVCRRAWSLLPATSEKFASIDGASLFDRYEYPQHSSSPWTTETGRYSGNNTGV